MAAIREALGEKLRALPGCQVSAYMLANPTPPTIHLYPAEIEYDQTLRRGLDRLAFTVQAFTGAVTDIGAQKKLDTYLAPAGSGSVKAALEADPTLGGVVQNLRVTRSGGYQSLVIEGRGPVLVAEWTVEVFAVGNA